MLRRLSAAVIAVMFVFGFLAGLGPTYAAAASAAAGCQQSIDNAAGSGHPATERGCDTRDHTACLAHAACAAFLLSVPIVVPAPGETGGWRAVSLSGLTGATAPPATPPPIAAL